MEALSLVQKSALNTNKDQDKHISLVLQHNPSQTFMMLEHAVVRLSACEVIDFVLDRAKST